MNDAELAQKLGEAMRQYAIYIKNGNVQPFRKFQTQNTVDFSVTLTSSDADSCILNFKEIIKETPQVEAPIAQESIIASEFEEETAKSKRKRRNED